MIVDRGDVRVKTAATLLAGAYLTVLRYELPSAAAGRQKAVADKAKMVAGPAREIKR